MGNSMGQRTSKATGALESRPCIRITSSSKMGVPLSMAAEQTVLDNGKFSSSFLRNCFKQRACSNLISYLSMPFNSTTVKQ